MEDASKKAAELAMEGLFIDGGHHKQWYLEQIARILLGDEFEKQVSALAEEGYEYEPGIAP